jgi:DNA-binding transcriptional ArsR family regulator
MTPTTSTVATDRVEQAERAAKLFRSLGDPTRLRLVLCLLHGEHRVVDLVAEVGLAQSTVSAHLACLRDCGLLDMRPVGRQSYYRLAHDVQELLAAAESLLGRIGYDVSLCTMTPGPASPPARP